jgi:hypothetical protein
MVVKAVEIMFRACFDWCGGLPIRTLLILGRNLVLTQMCGRTDPLETRVRPQNKQVGKNMRSDEGTKMISGYKYDGPRSELGSQAKWS